MDYKKNLKQFHRQMFIKTGDWRADINQKFIAGNPTTDLRIALIAEEAAELCDALQSGTLDEVRKELCDLLYVTFALAAIYDLPVAEDFKLVHANNMLKFETGFIGPNGKWLKAKDHPKVDFATAPKKVPFETDVIQYELEIPDCIVP